MNSAVDDGQLGYVRDQDTPPRLRDEAPALFRAETLLHGAPAMIFHLHVANPARTDPSHGTIVIGRRDGAGHQVS